MKSPQKTKPSASPRQLAANRANAAHSTGPRTPEGKAVSARNSLRHGISPSNFAVVRLEDLQEVAHLKARLVAAYQPVNSQELFALERMAVTQQTIRRAARLEAGLFTTCLNETLNLTNDEPFLPMNQALAGDGDIEVTRAQNRNYLLAEGFHRLTQQSNSWSLFLRYQAQAERLYRRAVEEFDRLKALRNELPNEPILDLEPEETTATYSPSETNPIPPPTAALSPSPRPANPPAPPPNPIHPANPPAPVPHPPAPSATHPAPHPPAPSAAHPAPHPAAHLAPHTPAPAAVHPAPPPPAHLAPHTPAPAAVHPAPPPPAPARNRERQRAARAFNRAPTHPAHPPAPALNPSAPAPHPLNQQS